MIVWAGAVISVTLFGSMAPDSFGVFDSALLSLFYVTSGEPWPAELETHNSDGSTNWVVGSFTIVFTIIAHWIVLEVPRPDPSVPPASSLAPSHSRSRVDSVQVAARPRLYRPCLPLPNPAKVVTAPFFRALGSSK